MQDVKIRNFLEISYEELETLNLEAKHRLLEGHDPDELKEHYLRYLKDERYCKAVALAFSDLEGRFHMLDFDKKYLLKSHEHLTFDGSSIRGFSEQRESDLRLEIDWASFRWLPSDVFGPGRVLIYTFIRDREGQPYHADMRGRLQAFTRKLKADRDWVAQAAFEIEGFLFKGLDAEQRFRQHEGFQFVSEGGYFHSLPLTPLKKFIDHLAEAQRALGFENEKDHPEVAPSQFELNYSYCDALVAADQAQLYKLVARQIAASMGATASFLPKPRTNINGSGMHTNISLSKGEQNLLHDAADGDGLSPLAREMISRLLASAEDLCLIMNPSVNAYRRLDPAFEAPNQIRVSAVDRSAMIRIPLCTERSARFELRSVGPDANPYLLLFSLFHTALSGKEDEAPNAERVLPNNIHDAISDFSNSQPMLDLLGAACRDKYASLKMDSANRCPKDLGRKIKSGEVLFHHEVTNQHLWASF